MSVRLTCMLGLTLSSAALASQFVFQDVTYEHSPDTTHDSHYIVNASAQTPANWVSPVNYLEGRVHMRLEVLTKPDGAAPTRYQLCFLVSPYECPAQAPTYTTTGVVEWEDSFDTFYFSDPSHMRTADYSKGVKTASLILKDNTNQKPAPENPGWEEKWKLYMPTRVHFTMTVMSKGEVYKPPVVVDSGTPDAGTVPDAGAGPKKDAGSALDAGVAEEDAGVTVVDPQPVPPVVIVLDAGGTESINQSVGSTCAVAPSAAALLVPVFAVLALLRRRRARP